MSHDEESENPTPGVTPGEWEDRVNDAYFDKMGAEFGQRTRDRINWMCAQARGATALDVGCSQGITTILLAREGMDVLGIDISEASIAVAVAAKAQEIESVQSRIDFQSVDLASLDERKFDTVLMGEVVEHQTNPQRFIRQANRFLAPGGTLVLTIPFGLHPWPDHKSTILPRHVLEAFGGEFSIVSLTVDAGYIRCVAEYEVGVPDPECALLATEVGAVASQVKFYEANREKSEYVGKLAQAQAEIAEFSKKLSELEHENQALRFQLAVDGQRLESGKQILDDHRQRGVELAAKLEEREAKLSNLQAADVHVQLIQKELARALEGESRKEGRISQLEISLGEAQKLASSQLNQMQALQEAVARLQTQLGRLEGFEEEVRLTKEELARVETEKAEAGQELQSMLARVADAEVELEHARDQTVAALAENADLVKRNETSYEKLCLAKAEAEVASEELDKCRRLLDGLRNELGTAQYKRSGHYAHLEVERKRNRALLAMAESLHEKNERYRGSLALELGRALIGLGSLSGIAHFPARLWRVYRSYAARRANGVVIEPLVLPKIDPVRLPKPPKEQNPGLADRSESRSEPTVAPARGTGQPLTVHGWTEDLTPGKPVVMSVLDEFTRSCFSGQANLVEPRPDNWEGLLEKYQPKFLLVESAWKGNHGSWQYRVANYANPPGDELTDMVLGFKDRGIPTVFWNKEDPVHFTNFIDAAARFDLILTTAEEALPKYAAKTQARTGVLQFAADEHLHNPIESGSRNGKVCFAGSFYSNRFKERRDDQLMLLDAASQFDLDIFDRNYDPKKQGGGDFAFPERFSRFIRGALPYDEINKAYRQYKVFLNVNSVVDSPTMFSRRVFELLASGTPIVSTWAKGTELTFGDDLIWHVRNQEEAVHAIRTLLDDEQEWKSRSLRGIRAVMSAHTYRHRFAEIERALGFRHEPVNGRDVLVVASVRNQAELRMVAKAFARQVLPENSGKRMICVTDDDLQLDCEHPGVELIATRGGSIANALESITLKEAELVAPFVPGCAYGMFYLQDMLHALSYSGASVVGKPSEEKEGLQYIFTGEFDRQATLINPVGMSSFQVRSLISGEKSSSRERGLVMFSADNANFKRSSGEGGDRWLETALEDMQSQDQE